MAVHIKASPSVSSKKIRLVITLENDPKKPESKQGKKCLVIFNRVLIMREDFNF